MALFDYTGFFFFVLLLANIYAVVATVKRSTDIFSIAMWIAIIAIFPLGGFITWCFFGPSEKSIFASDTKKAFIE
jgi:hypothetical protein